MSNYQVGQKGNGTRAGVKTWGKMLFYIVIGGVVGGTASMLILILRETGGFTGLDGIYEEMLKWMPAVQTAAFLILFLPSLVYYIRAARGMKRMYSDEEDEQNDQDQGKAMLISSTNIIVEFLLFGLAADPDYDGMMVSVGLFFVFTIICCIQQALLVFQIKRRTPIMKGDPLSWNFQKEWEGSMDEATKMITYRSGYKAYLVVQKGQLLFSVLAVIGRMLLSTGAFPVIISCGLWLVGNTVYTKNAMKNKLE